MPVMMVQAMNKQFITKHGHQSLMKKCTEPLMRLTIECFLSLPEGTNLGCVAVATKSTGYTDWRCLNTTSAQTGLCKDKVMSKTVAEAPDLEPEGLSPADHGQGSV